MLLNIEAAKTLQNGDTFRGHPLRVLAVPFGYKYGYLRFRDSWEPIQ